MRLVFLLLALWGSMLQTVAYGQTYKIETRYWGTEQGLSHREVNCIFQDRSGLIWVGTRNGLNRYDGRNFTVFTTRENGLTADNIVRIAEDKDGLLWLFNYPENSIYGVNLPVTNIDIFDPVTRKAEPFSKHFSGTVTAESQITSCVTNTNGDLILGSISPASTIHYRGNKKFAAYHLPTFKSFYPALVSSGKIWGSADGNNLIAVSQTNGEVLEAYNTGRDTIIHLSFIFEKDGQILADAHQSDEMLERYYRIRNGKMEIGRTEVLNRYHLPGNFNTYLFHPDKDVAVAFKFHVDEFTAPAFFNTKTGEKLPLPSSFRYPADNEPRNYFFDKDGALWLGTHFGLYRFALQKDMFTRTLFFEDNKPFSNSIRGISVAGDKLLANVEKYGLIEADLNTGSWSFSGGGQVPKTINWSIAIFNDNKGDVWSYNGDYLYNISKADRKPYFIKDKYVWSGFQDDDGVLYLGTFEALRYILPGESHMRLYDKLNGYNELGRSKIAYISKDDQGIIWLCTTTGLYSMDANKGITGRYHKNAEGKYQLPGNVFWHLHIDKEGVFWLGTGANGLLKWDRKKGSCEQYTKSNGLSDNTIYAIYEDNHEHLWMSSDFGIMQFNKKNEEVIYYLPKDGTSALEYNASSHYKDNKGRIHFGSLNGITSFDPEAFYKDKLPDSIPFVITGFMQFGTDGDQLIDKTSELRSDKSIELSPGNYYFQLDFALLDYNQDNNISYAWKIDGLDNDWHFQAENSLKMAAIPYGSYTLRIRARTSNGLWSKNQIEIPVHVLPPFYLRWWFFVLSIILIASCSWFYLRWRTRSLVKRQGELKTEVDKQTETIRLQKEDLERTDIAKNRLFANISHELRTPLTLILSPLESILKTREDKNSVEFKLLDTARTNSKQLLQLTNEILDLSKLEAGKMALHEEPVRPSTVISKIIGMYEGAAAGNDISMDVVYEGATDVVVLLDIAKVERVINNLLSNALKFTERGGKIAVTATVDRSIRIEVSNTGRGIHPDDLPYVFDRYFQTNRKDVPIEGGTGIGLALCKELVAFMKGRIWVNSMPGERTTFIFEIPATVVGSDEVVGFKEQYVAPSGSEEMGNLVGSKDDEGEKLKTILLVEDNKSLRNYLYFILVPLYNIVVAENGKEGLEQLEGLISHEKPTDILVLTDVMMPLMDGFEMIDIIKKDNKYFAVPVVMLTARADINDKLRGLRIGVDDYILKPFNEQELLVRIGNLFNHASKRKNELNDMVETVDLVPIEEYQIEAEAVQDDVTDVASPSQVAWLADLEALVLSKAGDSILNVEWLSGQMTLSRRQLLRRIKMLTGLTPQEYILEIKLNKAKGYLENQTFSTIKAVALECGFTDTSHFSAQFKKRFGKSPSDYLKYSDIM